MPHNPGHDVSDENRNTENFAQGVKNASNDAAAQGLVTAGLANGIINIVYLHDLDNSDTGIEEVFVTATPRPDIFIYDWTQFDQANDNFTIQAFDPSQDTLVFINSDADQDGNIDFQADRDFEGGERASFANIGFAPGDDFYVLSQSQNDQIGPRDLIFLEPETEDPTDGFVYLADDTGPVPTIGPFDEYAALVYAGDPLDGLLG